MTTLPPALAPALAAIFLASVVSAAIAQDFVGDEVTLSQDLPPVLTPTRMREPLRDLPATVEVLPAALLSDYGIVSVSEALRLLGGVTPTRIGFANYDLKVRAKSSQGPSRVTVLIDGVEVDPSVLTSADLGALPVGVDDVDHIEITSGPATSGYAHALTTSIINIVTKHPDDVERAYARVTYGSHDTYTLFGRAGTTLGPASLRLALTHRERGPLDVDSVGVARSSALTFDRVSLRGSSPLGDHSSLAVDGAYLQGSFNGSPVDASPFEGHVHNGYASVVYSSDLGPRNELSVSMNHWFSDEDLAAPSCSSESAAEAGDDTATTLFVPPGSAGAADPTRGPGGVTTSPCNTPNALTRRTIAEIKDEHVFSDSLRVVGGLGTRQDQARDTGPGGASWSASYGRVFAGLGWRIHPDLVLNTGVSSDRASSADYDLSLHSGLNWHLGEDQTVRVGFAAGSWASDVLPTLDIAGNLVTREHMTSADAGYLLDMPAHGATLDFRLFWLRLVGQTVSEGNARKPPASRAYGEIYGAETRASADLSACCSTFIATSVQAEGNNSGTVSSSSDWNWEGSIGIKANLGGGWRTSAALYRSTRSTDTADTTQASGIADVSLIRDLSLWNARGRFTLSGRHVSRDHSPAGVTNDPTGAVYASLQFAY